MPSVHTSHKQHSLYFSVCLTLVCGIAAAMVAPSPVNSTPGPEGYAYLPFIARPVPTATPSPTPTPLPRLLDVRIEGSCSNFKGGSAQNPSGEWVCFKNCDSLPADMTNWRVQDAARHTYVFPFFTLGPGAIVRLHSGAGADTATDLYWGRGLVWNNDHDTVYLYDQFGRLVSRYSY
jgi:hypothetical protein